MEITEETRKNLIYKSNKKYNVKFRIDEGIAVFNKHVKKIISEHFGKITIVEGNDDFKDLDFGGIDCWSSIDGEHRSISLRASHQIKKNGEPWDTFTFGEREVQRRLKALNYTRGIHMPGYHIEYSYVDEAILSIRYVLCQDIFNLIQSFIGGLVSSDYSKSITWKNNGNKRFIAIECSVLDNFMIPMRRWHPNIGWDGPPLFKCVPSN